MRHTWLCAESGSAGLKLALADPLRPTPGGVFMARKDALLRLHARLVARRDALRKALNGDLESFREFAALNVVGDNVDAAVDTANDEISSQLAEIESRELGQIDHALQRIVDGVHGRCE